MQLRFKHGFALVAALVCGPALADRTVVVSSGLESIYSPFTWVSVATAGTASLVDANGAVIVSAPVGGVGGFTKIGSVFPAVPQAATAVKLQITVQQTGKTFTGTWNASHVFGTPLPLAAGELPTVIYDPTNPLGATLTATVVTPAPPPPAALAQSPAGATCPPSCPLVDPNGVAWSLKGVVVLVNGVDIKGVSDNYTDVNSLVMQASGLVRIISPKNGYFCMSPTTGKYLIC